MNTPELKSLGEFIYRQIKPPSPDQEGATMVPLGLDDFSKLVNRIMEEKTKQAQNSLLLQMASDRPLAEQKSKTSRPAPFKPELNRKSLNMTLKKERSPFFGYNAKSYHTQVPTSAN